jgi:Cu/Ag efflux pump CusA
MMMTTWFALLIRWRWLILVIALAGAAGGLVSLRGLSIDAVPDISPKQVTVLTVSPGLGPSEVEQLVSFPIENAMAGAPEDPVCAFWILPVAPAHLPPRQLGVVLMLSEWISPRP